jgi:hypothetical protein
MCIPKDNFGGRLTLPGEFQGSGPCRAPAIKTARRPHISSALLLRALGGSTTAPRSSLASCSSSRCPSSPSYCNTRRSLATSSGLCPSSMLCKMQHVAIKSGMNVIPWSDLISNSRHVCLSMPKAFSTT